MSVHTTIRCHPAKPSPTVNLLKSVYLFIQIVNMMQSALNQIVPSLMWTEEFQHCLQNQQLQHQEYLLVVSSAVTSRLVKKWNVPSIIQNTVGLTLSVRGQTAHFTTPPLPCHRDTPWNGFGLKPVNDSPTWQKIMQFESFYLLLKDSTELVRSLKLGIYCFHNMTFIAYLKCLNFSKFVSLLSGLNIRCFFVKKLV